jgi:hypothetical protein
MCTCNQQNPSSKPCKYTGIDLPTLGINTGDSVEESFQSVEDFAANLTVLAPNCNELMKYTETEAVPISGVNNYSTAANTIFTVPTAYAGIYEVNYVGEVRFEAVGLVSMYIDVQGSRVSLIRTVKCGVFNELNSVQQINLFASNIALDEGDVLQIKVLKSNLEDCILENCILKITRL